MRIFNIYFCQYAVTIIRNIFLKEKIETQSICLNAVRYCDGQLLRDGDPSYIVSK